MNPLQAFKQSRQAELEAAGAAENQRRDEAVAAFRQSLGEIVGDEAVQYLGVTWLKHEPPTFGIEVADHIPIVASVKDGVAQYTVRRRMESKTFEHLADALTFGQPYVLNPKSPPAELPEGTIDTLADAAVAAEGEGEGEGSGDAGQADG